MLTNVKETNEKGDNIEFFGNGAKGNNNTSDMAKFRYNFGLYKRKFISPNSKTALNIFDKYLNLLQTITVLYSWKK